MIAPDLTAKKILKKRSGIATDADIERVGALLDDARAIVGIELEKVKTTPSDAIIEAILSRMVLRADSSADFDGAAVSQFSQSASPYSASVTFANPTGDLYLTRQEKAWLGLKRQKLAGLMPDIGGHYATH